MLWLVGFGVDIESERLSGERDGLRQVSWTV
jgi:hypothetical protein